MTRKSSVCESNSSISSTMFGCFTLLKMDTSFCIICSCRHKEKMLKTIFELAPTFVFSDEEKQQSGENNELTFAYQDFSPLLLHCNNEYMKIYLSTLKKSSVKLKCFFHNSVSRTFQVILFHRYRNPRGSTFANRSLVAVVSLHS